MPFIVRWTIGILVLIAATAAACKIAGAQVPVCQVYDVLHAALATEGKQRFAVGSVHQSGVVIPVEFWVSPASGEWTVVSRVGPLGCRLASGSDFSPDDEPPPVPGKDS